MSLSVPLYSLTLSELQYYHPNLAEHFNRAPTTMLQAALLHFLIWLFKKKLQAVCSSVEVFAVLDIVF